MVVAQKRHKIKQVFFIGHLKYVRLISCPIFHLDDYKLNQTKKSKKEDRYL
jgi:hypothetical protein